MFCPLCDKWEQGTHTDKVISHHDILPFQRTKYLEDKKQIGEGDTETILITQDFTQLDLESGFIQDLIICCYWHDPDSKDGLGREYRHFVGEKGDKNTINFVAECWKQLLEENWFDTPSKVLIWSDGGPKHFKISANLKLFQAIQKMVPNISWKYHFFPAYHGYNVCDAIASHTKKRINEYSRNFHQLIDGTDKVTNQINTLTNYWAITAIIPKLPLVSETFTNITKYFKFIAPADENKIYAYGNSYCKDSAVLWEVFQRFSIKELK
jgi:hypothetical protein